MEDVLDNLLMRTLYGYEEKGSIDICKDIKYITSQLR